ncbi:hypothetical protein CU026_0991 [Enterococcus faecium]|nr:hypothetical protein [Enterococcus faecium]MBK4751879.1 hypothetical protein [Enterococcus faecium]MBK4763053.1 hypothetical protein [Enterococcus faecium]MBK4787451.1 hypothetical protein [Enterococcus faecium]MBK4789787.1 hypothetical protein [Enterococcus faecium]
MFLTFLNSKSLSSKKLSKTIRKIVLMILRMVFIYLGNLFST